jgi:purine-binding chemotaxis protein CheW
VTSSAGDKFILLTLGGTQYALRSRDVRHVEMLESVTPVPNASPHVDGVVFSRGEVVPVLNLRARLGLERVPTDMRSRLLVVGRDDRRVGLLVDSAREFLTIPADAIQAPPDAIARGSGRYLEGVAAVGERLVLVLNLAEVLSSES